MTTTQHSGRSPSTRCPPVRVTGEIDIATAPRLRRALEHASADASGRVVVDLSGVTFMDCAGLGPLLEAEARLGGRLLLRGVPPSVFDLLRLTGLLARFGIPDDALLSGPAGDSPSGILEIEEKVSSQRARVGGRARIDQAKGLIMATQGCDAEQAWQMLFHSSRSKGVQVHDLAEALTEAAAGRDMDQSSAAMRAAVLAVMAPAGQTPDDAARPDDRPALVRHDGQPPDGREVPEGT